MTTTKRRQDPLGRSLHLTASRRLALCAAAVIGGSAWPIQARSVTPIVDTCWSAVFLLRAPLQPPRSPRPWRQPQPRPPILPRRPWTDLSADGSVRANTPAARRCGAPAIETSSGRLAPHRGPCAPPCGVDGSGAGHGLVGGLCSRSSAVGRRPEQQRALAAKSPLDAFGKERRVLATNGVFWRRTGIVEF